jgi:hypothetical protein
MTFFISACRPSLGTSSLRMYLAMSSIMFMSLSCTSEHAGTVGQCLWRRALWQPHLCSHAMNPRTCSMLAALTLYYGQPMVAVCFQLLLVGYY